MSYQTHILKVRDLLTTGQDPLGHLALAGKYVNEVAYPYILSQHGAERSKHYSRLNSLRNLIDFFCFFQNHVAVPPHQWKDLAPDFVAALILFIDSEAESPYESNTPPQVGTAMDLRNERRDALAKKGFFTEDEVYRWYDGSGS